MTALNIKYIDFGRSDTAGGSSGIDRKKLAQIKELGKLGEVTRVSLYDPNPLTLWKKISCRLPFFPSLYAYDYTETFNGTDVVYMRRSYTDRYTIRLLKKIRTNNPDCIILFELPTYPYDNEMKGSLYPILLKERWNRRKLRAYVDRIVLVAAKDPIVFGVPTITITNGIDFTITPLRRVSPFDHDQINAVIVGNYEYWHGLDRLIEGMVIYYKNISPSRKFVLHVVGSINNCIDLEVKDISELISKGYLKFYNALPFDEVNQIYDVVSLAFDSFGGHRRSVDQISSSIKSREYGAKGLPVVSASEIDYLSGSSAYFLKIPEDESPVDIKAIISFYDRVYSEDSYAVANKIRAHAEEHCSSEAMMKPVIDHCREQIRQRAANSKA